MGADPVAYVYAALWFAVGLLLIFRLGRENRVFYLLGAFFLFLGAWWMADELSGVNLFVGLWAWILRGVTLAALVVSCVVFYKELKKNRQDYETRNDKK
jgi:apolipoprotein N-acyltransferase